MDKRDVNTPGRMDLVQGHAPKSYKEAQDLYERAKAILVEMGKVILPSEDASLYYGFHVALRGEMNVENDTGSRWELVAEAARRAVIGEGIKVRNGKNVITLVARDSHYKDDC